VDILEKSVQQIQQTLVSVEQTLDESIHGHSNAKKQILKIVSQWMTGEQSGYCFGFEGSPGIGKTSLAKHGLAKCLRLQNGQTRPFAFIALGGSCNGSTLEGHNYTYVNSTWGRIVDVLMDAKCMNPIIYIDELDKVSKTEHGKEIIGILTHLIDSTQNNVFQDKFFSGVDLDLSKALFVFSYNDPQQIDRILLDRIHRVHFDNLSLAEKLVIAQKYIIPELHQKMGFHHRTVALSEETLTHLIETYTYEPGVRKLKEVLFDLFGEINLQLLSDKILPSLPILITPENLATIYLRKYVKHTPMTIHVKPQVGVVLGLWASTCGKGGVLPIQSKWFPSSSIWELKLTGNQGDVMKESMNVAKTVVWNALGIERQGYWNTIFQTSKSHGIHVHCPDSSTPKDGPSAGTAIALSLYSLFCDLDVPHTIAITGEVNLQGAVTKIGGINEKWLGGIQAGVQHFLYPKDNEEDARLFFEKYPECKSKYQFSAIETFEQALRLVFPQL
jgi:ATP-dependent Lon protease